MHIDTAPGQGHIDDGKRVLELPRRLTVACCAILLGLGTYAIGWGSGAGIEVAWLGTLALAVAAAYGGSRAWVHASHSASSESHGWRLVALACLVWTIGEVTRLGVSVWGASDGVADVAANAGYLVMLPLLLAGIFLLSPQRRRGRDRLRLLLDLVIATATLLTLSWSWVVRPAVENDELSRIAMAAVALHALGDGALVLALLIVLLRSGNRALPPAFGLVVVSFMLVTFAELFWLSFWADSGRETVVFGAPVWAVGFLAAGIACRVGRLRRNATPRPQNEVDAEREPSWRTVLPYPCALLLLVLIASEALADKRGVQEGIIVVGSLVIVALAIVRQGLTLRESQRTTRSLTQQVDCDPLTGLMNHRKVHQRLDRELGNGRDAGKPVAVALLDVDNFKAINDRFGHQAGDRVLRTLATVLRRTCRGTDVAARYAGDEFVLVLPGLDQPDAHKVGRRLLAEIARQRDLLTPQTDVAVSVSIGLAVTRLCDKPSREMIAIADAAMYEAKSAGKNRLVIVDADSLVKVSAVRLDYPMSLVPQAEAIGVVL
ncbi:MAG: hypothetical protein QOF73_871 [Thermomicrobiales bacterium]|nr:hypothetical protein [Thermomicrobiales bacterium]